MRPAVYTIVIRGRLGDRFAAAFDGMTIEPGRGESALVGRVADQADLLERVRDLGLELLRLEPTAGEPPTRSGERDGRGR